MSFTCPVCEMTSYNPADEAEGYCGNCDAFTGELCPECRGVDGIHRFWCSMRRGRALFLSVGELRRLNQDTGFRLPGE